MKICTERVNKLKVNNPFSFAFFFSIFKMSKVQAEVFLEFVLNFYDCID